MQDPKDATNNDGREPSFSDPKDPRWSQGHQPAPAPDNQHMPGQQGGREHNPYQDQPLYAPPGTPQNPHPNQPPYQGPGAGNHGYPQQQPVYQQPMGHRATMEGSNVLGIVSMVAGILGLLTSGMFFLPQLAAVICGHLSLSREKPRRGFAIAGLITGYVGLAIGLVVFLGFIAVFAGMGLSL